MLLVLLILLSIVFIVVSTARWQLHPFLALIVTAIGFGLCSGMPLPEIAKSINSGFGNTIGHIGIVIIAGTIIGVFLEKSGGAYVMAEKLLRVLGEKQVPLGMAIIGYITSISVFADSGFVIVSPLNKALTKQAGISLAASAIALSLGLTVSHTLIPPTPGPVAAAALLQADLGLVVLFGMVISIIPVLVGWLFASTMGSRILIDPQPELGSGDLRAKRLDAPSFLRALSPVLLPVVLIIGKSFASLPSAPFGEGTMRSILYFFGEPVIALLIGVCFACTLPKTFERRMLSTAGWTGKALLDAALIIMVTGAGGAFGQVLKHSEITSAITELLTQGRMGLWFPFLLAAAIKTAQGSSTVAIITVSSIMAPLLSSMDLDSDLARVLVVLIIGAGSMVVSHANDSFFWVVTQMSNMDVKTGYRLHSTGTLIIGVSSALVIWILGLFIL